MIVNPTIATAIRRAQGLNPTNLVAVYQRGADYNFAFVQPDRKPPARHAIYPDFRFVGFLDLQTGCIEQQVQEPRVSRKIGTSRAVLGKAVKVAIYAIGIAVAIIATVVLLGVGVLSKGHTLAKIK